MSRKIILLLPDGSSFVRGAYRIRDGASPSTATTSLESHPDIPGLFYIPEFLSVDEAKRIEEFIRASDTTIHWKSVGTGANSRRASHSGYDYDYASRKIVPAAEIPIEFQRLADKALELSIVPEELNQCLLNEYVPEFSHGINWHMDLKDFGPVIVCYTLGSGTEMQFRDPKNPDVIVPVRVEPRSVYIMSGDARWKWQHSMPGRKSDPNPDGGGRLKRGTRYSITFRSYQPS